MRRAAPILVVPLLAAVLLTLFAWPASRLEPRDLRVAVLAAWALAGAAALLASSTIHDRKDTP
jgi:hypothetical protein